MPVRNSTVRRGRAVQQTSAIPDEIVEFLHRNAEHLSDLPQVINLAFSGGRKPEAWHVRILNKQVIRGFNKAAPVTVMLSLDDWRKLMKKNDRQLWEEAYKKGQIQIHGDAEATAAVARMFHANGKHNGELKEEEPEQAETEE
ncbi:MAG: hypothetical protein Q9P14_17895 [candidate division KSB1 bacterium]|nr:hypothetical protein [candidate division KSB1 bacterium]MDQ7065958.1 hypothetical protein [candidate division KSB1 bacterium]